MLTVGTRGSALALHQANIVGELLAARHPQLDVQVRVITSQGDLDKESPLTKIGGRGVFTSSLQRTLTLQQVDAAVHSSKDVPSLSAIGLALAAFPQREDARDVVVSRHGMGLAGLPPNPVVGTSSRRRAVQVQALRPDAQIIELRGNIDTRLQKAMAEPYDAVILAAAGLTRMGWIDRATELLPVNRFTPAPGQGALAVETREAPDPAFALVAQIDDPSVRQALEIERAFLRGIGGGCTTPLGAHAVVETCHGQRIARFFGMLARDDGSGLVRVYDEWPLERAVDAAFDTAGALVREVHPNRIFGAGTEEARQLKGMKVIVTGTDDLASRAATEVERRGGDPVPLRTIQILPPADLESLQDALAELQRGGFDHLVLTSRQGVGAVSSILKGLPAETVKIGAIGEATAAALRDLGIEPDVVAEDSRGEGMLAALERHVRPGERVLLPLSSRARRVLAEGLARRGADVTRVDAYETRLVTEPDPNVVSLVEKGEIDAVLLASPSAVRGFVAQLGTLLPVLSGATFVAIGRMTADVMEEHGLPVHAVPSEPGAEAMVIALVAGLWGASIDEGA
ncbi:MAG TPA: hydroxymethylbilane synthase [Thermomicrobiales bacterium]|nr:hydroxymethylbilane synthase [Thermomicrobiales bacterium]